jgi:hypothetical protein
VIQETWSARHRGRASVEGKEVHVLYVPVIPPPPPSPRTRELADLLTRAIEEYEKYHPNVSGAEVRAALQMAATRSVRRASPHVWALVGGSVALVLGGAVAFLVSNQGGMSENAVTVVAVSVLIFGTALVLAMLKSRGG